MVRIVVQFADIRCPDALELFNYRDGHSAYHLASVCGTETTNSVSNDDTAIYTDSAGAVVTFRSFADEKKGRGFKLSYTIVDPEERTSSFFLNRTIQSKRQRPTRNRT